MEKLEFYIDGKWVKPVHADTLNVINPATEEAVANIFGNNDDVDRAVSAARRAFEAYAQTPVKQQDEPADHHKRNL